MIFHIIKLTRAYSGHGYAGPSCDRAGVPRGKDYTEVQEAIDDAAQLAKVNTCGWQVVEAGNGEVVRMVPTANALMAARDLLAPIFAPGQPVGQPCLDDEGTLFVTWLVNGVSVDLAVEPDGSWTAWCSDDAGFRDWGTGEPGEPIPKTVVTEMQAMLAAMGEQVSFDVPDRLTPLLAALPA